MATELRLVKSGLVMRVGPLEGPLRQELRRQLRYEKLIHVDYARGVEEGSRRKSGRRRPQFVTVNCYTEQQLNGRNYLVFLAGYLDRVRDLLKANGCRYVVNSGCGRPGVFDNPRWEILEQYDLRPGQAEVVRILAGLERGQVKWPTGTGKSLLIELICRVFPKARIAVVTRFNDPLVQLHRRLSSGVCRAGLICGSQKKHSDRLTCYSIGCLKYAHQFPAPDLLLADEVHELGSPDALSALSGFRDSRMYGFSASCEDRTDGADFELEALFGKVVTRLSYAQAVSHDMIVPIEVHWRTVKPDDGNPCEGVESTVARLRHGIWRNDYRNWLIARDARRFPKDQVLITVATTEHAVFLKALLPEFTLCYASMDEEDLQKYIDWELLPEGYRALSVSQRSSIKAAFECGKLRQVIATPVWKRGIDFRHLGVLIRADAAATMVDDTQIPGRLSRTCEQTGKRCGILIDYDDSFDRGFRQRAGRRKTHYASHGWRQIKPGDPDHICTLRPLA